jgi:hypothetical protein
MKKNRRQFALTILSVMALHSPLAWGQATDVVCTQCVNRTDVANDSVTSSQIKNGTITKADIAASAITSNRIKQNTLISDDFAAESIKSSRIKDGTITNADIATNGLNGDVIKNGTITDQHLANSTISAAKLAPNAVFNSIIVITSDPLDPLGNCAELTAALASFGSGNTLRTLIKLEAGQYDCSNGGIGGGIVVQPYVVLEGSGQGSTTIFGDTAENDSGVVHMAASSELRFLTVENIRIDNGERHALHVDGLARASYVTLITGDIDGQGDLNEAIECGSNPPTPSIILDNSHIVAEGDSATDSCGGGVYISSTIAADNGMGSGVHKCHASFSGTYQPFDTACGLSAALGL